MTQRTRKVVADQPSRTDALEPHGKSRHDKTLPMRISPPNRCSLSICLALLFASAASHAEIYKWVDANGKTHYSERKDDAGRAKAVELKAASPAKSTTATDSPAEYWQDQERQFRQRQIQKQTEKPVAPIADAKPKSLSGGRSDGTDASRCNLARDVLSGAVRHPDGSPTDDYDREVAQNDIRTYCR